MAFRRSSILAGILVTLATAITVAALVAATIGTVKVAKSTAAKMPRLSPAARRGRSTSTTTFKQHHSSKKMMPAPPPMPPPALPSPAPARFEDIALYSPV